jgi:hypothetical protein
MALPAFTRAVDSMFGKLGMTAMFQPVMGANLTVTVIPKRPDEIIGLGQSDVATEVTLFDVRVLEVAAPKSDDAVIYNGTEYRIIGEPRRDIHQLIWTMETVKA